MNKNFNKLLTLIVVFSMIMGMGVGFGLMPASPSFSANEVFEYPADFANITSSNNLSYVRVFWFDNSTLYAAFSIHNRHQPDSNSDIVIKNTNASEFAIYQSGNLVVNGEEYVAGGTPSRHWLVAKFNLTKVDLLELFNVSVDVGAGGHNIAGSMKLVDNQEYWDVDFVAGANGSLTGTTTYTNILDGTEWGSAGITVPTPVPADGYQFNGWSPVFPETIEGDLTFTASFSLIPVNPPVQPPIFIMTTYSISFITESGGILEGTTTINAVPGTVWSLINVPTPVANEGFEFVGWDTEFPANIYQNWTFTARFAEIEVIELEEEEIPEAAPEVEEEIEVEEPIEIEEEETPEAIPTLPKTGYVDPMTVSGIGIALLGLGFALRKRNK